MDLAFSRGGLKPAPLTIDALLARLAASQAATPTARAQHELDDVPNDEDCDPRVLLFASLAAPSRQGPVASFAASFSPRQPN